MGVAILDRTVLGQDGDPALTLEIVAVHDTFGHSLVGCKGAGLTQQLVDQSGFAMVDVSDDGDIADCAGHGERPEVFEKSTIVACGAALQHQIATFCKHFRDAPEPPPRRAGHQAAC